MAFCTNCGQELQDGAKFCGNCGKAVNGSNSSNQRKTVYDGELHKCPNCGELLGAFVAKCPTCMYEIRGTTSSRSVKEFALKLEGASDEAQTVALIRGFPIPNTKEDVFEFMILASTNMPRESSIAVARAWGIKFEQSYQKAKLLFDEGDLLRIQEIYDSTRRKTNTQKVVQGAKTTGNMIAMIGRSTCSLTKAVLKCFFSFIRLLPKLAKFILKNLFVFLSILAFLKAISSNDIAYELLGGVLLISSAAILFKKGSSYLDVALVIGAGVLTFFLATFLENGAGLQLFGGISLILSLISVIKKPTQN